MGVGLVRSLQPPDILWIHWRVYNFIANTSKWVLFLPPSDAYVRSFLYLLYFNKTLLHKSSERSSLVSGPRLNSSPPGAKNPSVFMIQQQPFTYMTTGKTIALTRRTFVGKVMSLLFNMQSRLDITFLPRSKHLLISWLQSPSAVSLEPPKIKSVTVSTVSPSICHEVMVPDAMIFVF